MRLLPPRFSGDSQVFSSVREVSGENFADELQKTLDTRKPDIDTLEESMRLNFRNERHEIPFKIWHLVIPPIAFFTIFETFFTHGKYVPNKNLHAEVFSSWMPPDYLINPTPFKVLKQGIGFLGFGKESVRDFVSRAIDTAKAFQEQYRPAIEKRKAEFQAYQDSRKQAEEKLASENAADDDNTPPSSK